MNKRPWLVVGAVIVGLLLIVLLGPVRQPAPVPTLVKNSTRPVVKFVHLLQRPLDELPAPSPQPVAQPGESNAASIYRQAFALCDALSTTNETILSDWRTNVDTAVEVELCKQLRLICDLLHQASTSDELRLGDHPAGLRYKAAAFGIRQKSWASRDLVRRALSPERGFGSHRRFGGDCALRASSLSRPRIGWLFCEHEYADKERRPRTIRGRQPVNCWRQ